MLKIKGEKSCILDQIGIHALVSVRYMDMLYNWNFPARVMQQLNEILYGTNSGRAFI